MKMQRLSAIFVLALLLNGCSKTQLAVNDSDSPAGGEQPPPTEKPAEERTRLVARIDTENSYGQQTFFGTSVFEYNESLRLSAIVYPRMGQRMDLDYTDDRITSYLFTDTIYSVSKRYPVTYSANGDSMIVQNHRATPGDTALQIFVFKNSKVFEYIRWFNYAPSGEYRRNYSETFRWRYDDSGKLVSTSAFSSLDGQSSTEAVTAVTAWTACKDPTEGISMYAAALINLYHSFSEKTAPTRYEEPNGRVREYTIEVDEEGYPVKRTQTGDNTFNTTIHYVPII